jgi:hypothetical protein
VTAKYNQKIVYVVKRLSLKNITIVLDVEHLKVTMKNAMFAMNSDLFMLRGVAQPAIDF